MLQEDLLFEILRQPSAPFCEAAVMRVICNTLEAAKIPFVFDKVGNLLIGTESEKKARALAKKSTKEPLRVFVAHTDHPGFHGTQIASPKLLQVAWHGGAPTAHLEGAKVWVCELGGEPFGGVMTKPKLASSGKTIESALIELDRPWSGDPKKLFGGFAFRDTVWKEGNLIYTKAADDLVGAFAVLSLMLKLKPSARKNTLGLLTRGEEIGFVGAIEHFELGWWKAARRKILMVSLETSRTLSGAEIGKGPVVRLGDRAGPFDPGCLHILSGLAKTCLKDRHQRRIMDGGTCEATAALAWGFATIGISVPLGNYHNQSLEGGPDASPPNGPAPEFVHLDDVAGLLTLCESIATAKADWDAPFEKQRRQLLKQAREYRPFLQIPSRL